MKLCIDCAHMRNGRPQCVAPQNMERSPVDGTWEAKMNFCSNLRLSECGPEATWFEPKPPSIWQLLFGGRE